MLATALVATLLTLSSDSPAQQEAYVKAAFPGSTLQWGGDYFGWHVAMSGDTLVIGALGEEGGASGVNGDQTDNSEEDSGAAYVFRRGSTGWVQEAYLKASQPENLDWFGASVGISGDVIVVGATLEDSGATGVDGDDTDNSKPKSGAAFVFERVGTVWTQTAYLKAHNSGANDRFGDNVAVSGNTIVIGAIREDSQANDDGSDNSVSSAGAAYVFERSGTAWTQTAFLKAPNAEVNDYFGRDVAISGDTILIGAPGEDSAATGVDGDQADNSALDAGAAYVFGRSGSTWALEAYLKASNAESGDFLGADVALSGDVVVVSAREEDGLAPGINPDEGDNSGSSSGAVYVFRRTGSTWQQEALFRASNAESSDRFGRIHVEGDRIVVGTSSEDSSAVGVGGDSFDNGADGSGAVYVFERIGTFWYQSAYLKASNAESGDAFGGAVAVSGNRVAVGASAESGSIGGINVDESSNSFPDAGAAYVFELFSTPIPYCQGKVNTDGCLSRIAFSGSPSLSANEPFDVTGDLVVAGKNGLLFYGLAGPTAVPFLGGTLCVQPGLRRTAIQNSGGLPFLPCDGSFSFDFNAWVQGGNDPLIGAGDSLHAQYWFRDTADTFGAGLTNGLQFSVAP